jgi:hypothetical protein
MQVTAKCGKGSVGSVDEICLEPDIVAGIIKVPVGMDVHFLNYLQRVSGRDLFLFDTIIRLRLT